ncbi:acetyl esterase [Humitalea rosea]|uniref:Acetyl esterase n=1 Tax=Humitalea rosea TaxID=990373 RepID=A0A2W7HVM2_9PROT|nr:alpha/beta hydrolase [Humitalea rosea]PZW37584.1 acetyl esterase [Humitalea rosea]
MTLDADAALLLDMLREAGRPPYHALSPIEARAAMIQARAAMAPPPAEVAEIRDLLAPGPHGPIPLRLYRGVAATVTPVLLFFHGGGWVIGDLQTHDGVCRHLAAGAGCTVIAVDYRLAPEHKFPAAVNDAIAALVWVNEQAKTLGIDPARIAVGGDSAGANLAAVLALMARDGAVPPVLWQMLLYPALDLSLSQDSYRRMGEGYVLTTATMAWFRDHYLRSDADVEDWRASPLRAEDLSNLAPALVLTAGHDPLVDEGEAYASRLRASGVAVEQRRYPGQMHGFLTMGKVLPTATAALDDLAQALARALTP